MAARKQYPLRIDPEVWEAVEKWADDEMRSLYTAECKEQKKKKKMLEEGKLLSEA